MKEELTIIELTRPKKENGLTQFTKRRMREVYAFFYDEDVLWLDIGTPGKNGVSKRIGINFIAAKKLRDYTIKDFEKALRG